MTRPKAPREDHRRRPRTAERDSRYPPRARRRGRDRVASCRRLRRRCRHARRAQAGTRPPCRRAQRPPLAPARQAARRLRLPVPPRRGHRHRPWPAPPQRRSRRVPGCDRPGDRLLRSGYQRDSALWIHRLAVRCQEIEPAAERPAYAQRPRPKPGDETAEALLAAVPGISTTSARALLERFGTVADVVAAGPDEWLSVPGIGPERVRALQETFTLRRGTPTSALDR